MISNILNMKIRFTLQNNIDSHGEQKLNHANTDKQITTTTLFSNRRFICDCCCFFWCVLSNIEIQSASFLKQNDRFDKPSFGKPIDCALEPKLKCIVGVCQSVFCINPVISIANQNRTKNNNNEHLMNEPFCLCALIFLGRFYDSIFRSINTGFV